MSQESKIRVKQLRQDEMFVFPYCAVREFSISPVSASDGASWIVSWYGEKVPYDGVAVSFGGKNNAIYSCPPDAQPGQQVDITLAQFDDTETDYIAVKGVSGLTVIHYIL